MPERDNITVLEFTEDNSLNITELYKADTEEEQDTLILNEGFSHGTSFRKKIEAIHAITTANYTTYTSQELQGDFEEKTGLYSWTHPYEKPVLTHHKQFDGEPIGRVKEAEFTTSTSAGPPGLILDVEISDEDAQEKVKDGRYKTVSIGCSVQEASCSICGQDWVEEGRCEHWPGRDYDGDTATLVVGGIEFKEVSFVNVPADKYAKVLAGKESEAFTEVLSEARDPEYEGTETADWDRPTLEDMAEALGWEDVESVDDLTDDQRNEAADMSLLGDPDADTFDELTFFIVVNPDGKDLNKGALEAVRGGRGQNADIPEKAYKSADKKAKELLKDEFDVDYDDESRTEQVNNINYFIYKNESTQSTKGGNEMAELEELKEQKETLEDEKQELEEELEELRGIEEEYEELQSDHEDLQEEFDEVVDELNEYKEAEHERLAEKVLDKKIELGLADEDNREELLEDHIERSDESLNDTLSDLEYAEEINAEEEEGDSKGEEVEKKGLHNSKEENVDSEEGEEDTELDEDEVKDIINKR